MHSAASPVTSSRSSHATTLDAHLAALPEPRRAALDRGDSVLHAVGAPPPDVVLEALAMVRALLDR